MVLEFLSEKKPFHWVVIREQGDLQNRKKLRHIVCKTRCFAKATFSLWKAVMTEQKVKSLPCFVGGSLRSRLVAEWRCRLWRGCSRKQCCPGRPDASIGTRSIVASLGGFKNKSHCTFDWCEKYASNWHFWWVVKGGPRGAQAPSIFWINENKCVFNKRTIQVCISRSWPCLGTSTPWAVQLVGQ